MSEVDPLLEAVEALTKPVIEHMVQIGDDGKWLRAHTIEHPPLLRQIADAVTPLSSVTGPGTPALPSERSPIDLHMLYEYSKIFSQIRSWCHKAGVPVTRPPHVDVVADLDAWAATRGRAEVEGFYVKQLRKWADLIRDLLNPGESFEADYPCPVCGATEWGDFIMGGSTRAILVTYAKDDAGHIRNERALCRPCSTVWEGHEAVWELAGEQHEKLA